MVNRILGLDLTKKMVSWALVEHDAEDSTKNLLVDCGGYVFKAGEIPKTGESPNVVRRNARLARNTIDKRQKRKKQLRKLFIEHGMFPSNVISSDDFSSWMHNRTIVSPWDLRAQGLDRLLTPEEFGRALYSIASKRGYQFTKAEENSAEDGDSSKMRDATKLLVQNMQMNGCRTIGEYLCKFEARKRNTHTPKTKSNGEIVTDKDGKVLLQGSHDRSISRYLLREEVKELFKAQGSFKNSIATPEFEKIYSDLTFYMPDPQSTENLVGNCSVFLKEKRAAKTQYEAELHVVLTRILNCRVIDSVTGLEGEITKLATIDELVSFVKSKEVVTHTDLRKFLNLDDSLFFKGLVYKGKAAKAKKANKQAKNTSLLDVIPSQQAEQINQEELVLDLKEAEKKVFAAFKGYHDLKRVLGDSDFAALEENLDVYNHVCWILTVECGDESRTRRLLPILKDIYPSRANEVAENLCLVSPKIFVEHHALSMKALKLITELMLEGKRYDEAVAFLGIEAKAPVKSKLMPALCKTRIECNSPRVIRMVASMRKVVNEIIRFHGSFNVVNIELGRDLDTLANSKMIENAQNERRKAKELAEKKIKELFGDKVKTSSRNITKYMLWEQQGGRCLYTGEVLKLEDLFEFDGGPYKVDYILPRSRSLDDSFGNMVLTTIQNKMAKADKTPFEWFGNDAEAWERYKAICTSSTMYAKLGRGKVSRLIKENFDENAAKEAMLKNIEDERMWATKIVKELFEDYMVLPKPVKGIKQVFTRNTKLTNELKRQWFPYSFKEAFLVRNSKKDEKVYDGRANIMNAIVIAFSGEKMVRQLSQYYKWKETKWGKDNVPAFELPYEGFVTDCKELLQLDRTEKDKNGVERKRLLIAVAPNKTVTGETNGATVISPKVAKEGKGVSVRQGNAVATTSGDIAMGDIYRVSNKTYLIPVYVKDMGSKIKPNETKNGRKVSIDDFVFSVFNGDLVSVNGVFYNVTCPTADVLIATDVFTGISRQLGTINAKIKKFEVTPLGYFSALGI